MTDDYREQLADRPALPGPEITLPATKKGSAWLDSTLTAGDRGTSSLLAHSPDLELIFDNGALTFLSDGRLSRTPATITDALEMLERLVNEQNQIAIGAISYEAMLRLLGLPIQNPPETPEMHFFLYNQVGWTSHPHESAGPSDFVRTPSPSGRAYFRRAIKFDRYRSQMERIRRHIREGDIYQANLTHRFDIASEATPFSVYRNLRRLSPSPYGAFINFGDYAVLSSSPERMFLKQGNQVTTGPIKGTIARGLEGHDDADLSRRLQNSEKDLAEHLMIVDLERNDLGQIARVGSVQVDALFRPEIYASLIHLTSDISAELRTDIGLAELAAALLPGGSITGAPKRRAVEILSEIEETPRGIYTGCLGYVTRDRTDFSIAIRTMTWQNGLYHVHAGGGIVADSTPELEYRELLLKASNMFRALGVNLQD
jgi:anthranilate/para-aminobenzoate synthase component I